MELNIKVIDNGFIVKGILPHITKEKEFKWLKGLDSLSAFTTMREFYMKNFSDLSDFLKEILE